MYDHVAKGDGKRTDQLQRRQCSRAKVGDH
jgi:hypothetical protein